MRRSARGGRDGSALSHAAPSASVSTANPTGPRRFNWLRGVRWALKSRGGIGELGPGGRSTLDRREERVPPSLGSSCGAGVVAARARPIGLAQEGRWGYFKKAPRLDLRRLPARRAAERARRASRARCLPGSARRWCLPRGRRAVGGRSRDHCHAALSLLARSGRAASDQVEGWRLSGRRSHGDLEHDEAIGRGERGLRGGMKRLEVELVAVGHGRQRLADPKVGIEELYLDRLCRRPSRRPLASEPRRPCRRGEHRRSRSRSRSQCCRSRLASSAPKEDGDHKVRVIPSNDDKDRPTVAGLASEPRATPLVEVAPGRVGYRCLDILRTDAVEPHFVPGVPAQPHEAVDLDRDEGGIRRHDEWDVPLGRAAPGVLRAAALACRAKRKRLEETCLSGGRDAAAGAVCSSLRASGPDQTCRDVRSGTDR